MAEQAHRTADRTERALEKARRLLGIESEQELDEAVSDFGDYTALLEALNERERVQSGDGYTGEAEHGEESRDLHPSLNRGPSAARVLTGEPAPVPV